MKYYNVSTRKRPEFEILYNNMCMRSNEISCAKGIPIYAVLCICGDMLFNRQVIFNHWQQGHFDTYEEVK